MFCPHTHLSLNLLFREAATFLFNSVLVFLVLNTKACTESVVMPLFSNTIFTLAYQLFSRNCQEALSWAFPKKQQQQNTIQQNLLVFLFARVSLIDFMKQKIKFCLYLLKLV